MISEFLKILPGRGKQQSFLAGPVGWKLRNGDFYDFYVISFRYLMWFLPRKMRNV